MPKTSPRIFPYEGSMVKICLINCTELSKFSLIIPPCVLKIETLDIHIFLILALNEKILGRSGTQGKVPQHAKWQAESPKHCQDMSLLDISSASHGTGYDFKDGNYLDNFAMLWNINKIFGMLEDLIGFKQSYQAFCCFMQKQARYACLMIFFTENHSEMRTCSRGQTQPHITPLKIHSLNGKCLGDVWSQVGSTNTQKGKFPAIWLKSHIDCQCYILC